MSDETRRPCVVQVWLDQAYDDENLLLSAEYFLEDDNPAMRRGVFYGKFGVLPPNRRDKHGSVKDFVAGRINEMSFKSGDGYDGIPEHYRYAVKTREELLADEDARHAERVASIMRAFDGDTGTGIVTGEPAE